MKLKKEAGSGLLESLIGKTADLQSQLAIADRRAAKFRSEIGSFQVLPEYHDLEQEASQIARTISDLTNANVTDQQRLLSLTASIEAEHAPAEYDVARVYDEAGVVLPDSILERLDQVRIPRTVLRNRRSHLESDFTETEKRIDQRDRAKRWTWRTNDGVRYLKFCSPTVHWTSSIVSKTNMYDWKLKQKNCAVAMPLQRI